MAVLMVPDAVREVDAATFADLGVALVGVRHQHGVVVLTFSGDLTPEQRAAVVERCQSSADTDELRMDVASVLGLFDAFLALPEPTAAEVVAQVRLLTRVVRAVVRLVLRRL